MLEKTIIQKVEEWRKGNITRWNRFAELIRLCSRTLKTLISKFESDVVSGISLSTSVNESPEIASISRVYKINGNPLNVPYTDCAALLAAIHNTDLHSNLSAVEFALAVHCNGYPGKFVSVWIFFVSLVRS